MIKPVYFGKGESDLKRLEFINKIDNFSEWVKGKIDEDAGIVGASIVDNKDIELLIRKILKEELKLNSRECEVNIETIEAEITDKSQEITITDGWTL